MIDITFVSEVFTFKILLSVTSLAPILTGLTKNPEINIWLHNHPCERRISGTLFKSLQKQKDLYGENTVQK